ncbi:MAG: tetratricopeptide repeat protein [Armatimonadetes bacterium]|nr:tetratricopeptide repeat protein [Armatimonadota bacterium]
MIDRLASTVPLERAAKRPLFLDWIADEYREAFGVPVVRADMQRLAECLGGHVLVCDTCRKRFGIAASSAGAKEPPPVVHDEAPSPAAVGGVPPATIDQCLADLGSADALLADQAVEALVAQGRASVPPLLEWVRTYEGDRSAGLRALGALRASEAADVLVDVYLHGRAWEQLHAQRALAAIGPDCLPAIGTMFASDASTSEDGRRRLLAVLGHWGGPALSLAIGQLQHERPQVRQAAVMALELCPEPRCVAPLIPLLADPVRGIRRSVAVLLGRIGDGAAVSALVQALDDPALEVRTAAMWALVRLGQPVSEEPVLLAAGKKAELWLAAALLQLGGQTRQQTETLLADLGKPIRLDVSISERVAAGVAAARQSLVEGAIEAAIEQSQVVCLEAPLEAAPLVALAQSQSKAGRWDGAVDTLTKLIFMDPFGARGHHNLGVAEYRLGRTSAAAEQWRQALLLEPDHPGAKEALSRAQPDEVARSVRVCLAHPARRTEDECAACRVPLCRDCSYAGPQALYCERHMPPVAEANRAVAASHLHEARTQLVELHFELAPERLDMAAEVFGPAAAVTIAMALGVDGALVHRLTRGISGKTSDQRARDLMASARAHVRHALGRDPTLEEAALLLLDLGELAHATGHPDLVPKAERASALHACASHAPRALAAQFLCRCESNCDEALWTYFVRLCRLQPTPWDAATGRVIDQAIEKGYGPAVATYLRGVLERLPRHSPERRQCSSRIRAIEAG